ncbi:hypothetical protein F5984_11970 [Rudanella paleaurantiibacter]|uniref:Uncharacterized protein n=1 Tax=Rudanella paleaurantiibacter TaxID=2614655 RepID=A0A7J5U032_9BACT|nr:hypothetical protein [Rudanella paleaurantiibacter]KAB7730855.1 hypothetical protein F5984_11970 [Rudanella paleaurantiibacter]
MSQLLIEIDTPEDEAILRSLLPKLNGRVVATNPLLDESRPIEQTNLKEAIRVLRNANTALKFGEAAEWQRNERDGDRTLYGR